MKDRVFRHFIYALSLVIGAPCAATAAELPEALASSGQSITIAQADTQRPSRRRGSGSPMWRFRKRQKQREEERKQRRAELRAYREFQVPLNLVLYSMERELWELSKGWREKPLVFMFASMTSPEARENIDEFQKLAEQYKEEANFIVIYTLEPHPQGSPSPLRSDGTEWVTTENVEDEMLFAQPEDIHDRMELAKKFKEKFEVEVPIYVDNMKNSTWLALKQRPNFSGIINTSGVLEYSSDVLDERMMERHLKSVLVMTEIMRKKMQKSQETGEAKVEGAEEKAKPESEEKETSGEEKTKAEQKAESEKAEAAEQSSDK